MEQFTITEAAKKLGVEAHVLRYWEDELTLDIKRNRQGHRYYDEKDIRMFKQIQELKEQGYMLKDVRDAIQKVKNMQGDESGTTSASIEHANEGEEKTMNLVPRSYSDTELSAEQRQDNVVDFKQAQLQAVMNKVVANAFRENKEMLMQSIKEEVTADVMRQFDTVMREKEEREEARYRKLDDVLRQIQQANQEVAATKTKRRFGFRS